MNGPSQYPASDELVVWLQSLSGMLTKVKTEYGSISQLVEQPDWDGSRTDLVLRLLTSLREHIEDVEKELSDHVRGKFG